MFQFQLPFFLLFLIRKMTKKTRVFFTIPRSRGPCQFEKSEPFKFFENSMRNLLHVLLMDHTKCFEVSGKKGFAFTGNDVMFVQKKYDGN